MGAVDGEERDPKGTDHTTESVMQSVLHMSAHSPLHPPSPQVVVDPRVAQAAAGDRAAAQALLTELLPRVRNLVRYLVRGDDVVDDITQLVLVELLRSFGNFRHDGSLHAWVHRITVRVALRHVKRQRRDRAQEAELGQALDPHASQPDEYLRRRQAIALLDQLPDEQRLALVLHHVAGMSVPELAEALDVPFETARSRLRLAMGKLRERLDATGVEP